MAAPILPDFSALRVAVVGDLIADRYLHAQPTRLSREAPVMVLRHLSEEVRPGGAANAARTLRALGARTSLIGCVGRDTAGRELLEVLEKEDIDLSGVVSVPGWTTPAKTRIQAADPRRTPQQILRIDREPASPVDPPERQRMAERVRASIGQVDALLVSDYDYGCLDSHVAGAAAELRASGAIVVLDPRRTMRLFSGSTAMTPNLEELAEHCNLRPEELEKPEDILRAASRVLRQCGLRWLLVTLGNRGMTLYGEDVPDGGLHVPASGPDKVIDVSGAGDTAAAVFALALAAHVEPARAMQLANAAAGVVVMEPGTAVCTSAQLAQALREAPEPALLAAAWPLG